MITTALTVTVLLVAALNTEASVRFRRDDRVESYCLKNQEHFSKYCSDLSGLDHAAYGKVAKFCRGYEKNCAFAKGNSVALPELGSDLVVPPPLPKGGDFAALDLPIGSQSRGGATPAVSKTRLTAAIINSCTPDCDAPHCTDECKCAHTHPKVHAMCNPPATAALANTCAKWYSKCPMFQPVQYY